jgi:hypothetical protein
VSICGCGNGGPHPDLVEHCDWCGWPQEPPYYRHTKDCGSLWARTARESAERSAALVHEHLSSTERHGRPEETSVHSGGEARHDAVLLRRDMESEHV